MANLDTILYIFERDDSIAELRARGGGFAWGEKVFEDLNDAGAERGGESFEDEMRVGFRDGASCWDRQIVS